jgi:signal transduction histidine kinase
LAVSLGVIFLVFASYEFVEHTWLDGVAPQVLHRLHILRGVLSSLIVAGIVGWMIVRTSPALLQTPAAIEEWARQSLPSEEERIRTYARWFIAMRWVAALLAGTLVFVCVHLLEWLPREVWWPLAGTIGVLVASNIVYRILLRRRPAVTGLLLVQAYADLVILTVLLHFSGGIENPLSMMLVFHVIIGGILLTPRTTYWIAATASCLFALLAWAEWADLVEHYTLQLFPHPPHGDGHVIHPAHSSPYAASWVLLQTVVLFLTAYFVTSLARRLRENERQFVAMADRALDNRRLLERALLTTGAGLRVLDHELRPYWASEHWLEWFVCREGESCPGCASLDQVESPARQCLRDGRSRRTEVVLDPSNCPPRLLQGCGCERIFQITSAPLVDAQGRVSQVVELAQDITEQKRTQRQVLQADKLAAVGELAGQVAHEVNNPVSVISAKASLLLSDYGTTMAPKVAQEITKIGDLAKRVARIAQGLLAYCRPSAAARLQLDLRLPIRKALATVDEQARRAGVRVEDQLAEEIPVVKANPHELEQVFLNLFSNALDAMPKGGWLNVSAQSNQTLHRDGRPAVAIVVADTGCGIPEEIRGKIFDPFFTTKQRERGTGLGLSICQGVVRGHGGELEVESKVWQGTRVIIRLPLDAPAVIGGSTHG